MRQKCCCPIKKMGLVLWTCDRDMKGSSVSFCVLVDDGLHYVWSNYSTKEDTSFFPEWDLCISSPRCEQCGLYWRQMLCPNIGTVLPVRKKAMFCGVLYAKHTLLLKGIIVLLGIFSCTHLWGFVKYPLDCLIKREDTCRDPPRHRQFGCEL